MSSTSMTGIAARILSLLSSVLVVGIVFRAGHTGGFALYAVATSIVAFLPFADLGLGLALVTQLPKIGDDVLAARRMISTSFFTLAFLAIAVTVLLATLGSFVDWQALLGVGTHTSAERSAVVVLVGIFAGAPMGVASKTLFSFRNAIWAFRIDCATALVSATLAVAGLVVGAPVEFFIFSTVWSPVFTATLASIVLFGFRWTHLRPQWSLVSRRILKSQLGLGASLAYAGVAVAVALQSDLLIVSHMLDERDVASYGLAMRLGVIFTSLVTVTVTPLWPEFARMIHQDLVDSIRSTLRSRTKATGLAAGAFAIFAVVAGPALLAAWSDNPQAASRALCLAIALSVGVQAIQLPCSMFVNASGHRRIIIFSATLMCAINLAFSLALTRLVGVEGPALGTAIGVVLGLSLPLGLYTRRELERMRARVSVSRQAVAP